MAVKFTRADLDDPRVVRFLREHLADMEPTAPPESRHALDLDGLRRPHVRVWVGVDGDDLVATGALATLTAGHEELKSMRTDPRRRGAGLGRSMLAVLLDDARSRGVRRVSLETGSMEFFAPARSLYAAAGFRECGPFGSYAEDPNSTFMTRSL